MDSGCVFSHELIHVEQHRELGPLFLFAYLWASLASLIRGHGSYEGNALELEAYARQMPNARRKRLA